MTRLRIHSRSGTYADQPEAARLMQYCTAREDLGPVGNNFGAACHQIDRADLMLTDLRDRNRHGTTRSTRQAERDTGGSRITVLARHDPYSQITTLVLDAVTANVAIDAIAAHAVEREAHLRRVQLDGQNLPAGSYGRSNREVIADRETRTAARLRAIEHEYHAAIERDAVPMSPESTGALRAFHPVDNREIELD